MANKFDVDPDMVKKLAALLNETGLSEIEYESAGRRIRVARQLGGNVVADVGATTTLAASKAKVEEDNNIERKGTAVLAPMVGTIFMSPEPGTAPFVEVGDIITEGQTVMLIEAMKTYNPVRATKGGKVLQILVSDSTPVEFGEELLLVE
jgi:acetyl-CoA carboxylase biotin carboxyl carrier protein